MEAVDAVEDDILYEFERLVRREEAECFRVDLGTAELPCELWHGDEPLGKLAKTFLIINHEFRGLLHTSVAGSSADVGEVKVAQLELAHVWWRGVPVDIDGLAEVETGGEDARLLDLALDGERKAGVARRSDVRVVDMELRRVQRMPRNGPQDGDQRDDERDDDDGRCDEQAAEAELAREILFFIWRPSSGKVSNGRSRLVHLLPRAVRRDAGPPTPPLDEVATRPIRAGIGAGPHGVRHGEKTLATDDGGSFLIVNVAGGRWRKYQRERGGKGGGRRGEEGIKAGCHGS